MEDWINRIKGHVDRHSLTYYTYQLVLQSNIYNLVIMRKYITSGPTSLALLRTFDLF